MFAPLSHVVFICIYVIGLNLLIFYFWYEFINTYVILFSYVYNNNNHLSQSQKKILTTGREARQ